MIKFWGNFFWKNPRKNWAVIIFLEFSKCAIKATPNNIAKITGFQDISSRWVVHSFKAEKNGKFTTCKRVLQESLSDQINIAWTLIFNGIWNLKQKSRLTCLYKYVLHAKHSYNLPPYRKLLKKISFMICLKCAKSIIPWVFEDKLYIKISKLISDKCSHLYAYHFSINFCNSI